MNFSRSSSLNSPGDIPLLLHHLSHSDSARWKADLSDCNMQVDGGVILAFGSALEVRQSSAVATNFRTHNPPSDRPSLPG